MFALAGCSSDSSPEDSSATTDSADSSASGASDDGAENDVASSSQVTLTLEFDDQSLSEIVSAGQQVSIARELGSGEGDEAQLQWIALQPLASNTISYDASKMQVFAANTALDAGATVDMAGTADAQVGDKVGYNENGTFTVESGGPSGSIGVENRATRRTAFGLAGAASVNGTDASGPYGVSEAEPGSTLDLADLGKLMVWVGDRQDSAGTVLASVPSSATTIDTTTDPTTKLTWNQSSGSFEKG